jgi:uncharacterized repeat protein (TIGR03803 family)
VAAGTHTVSTLASFTGTNGASPSGDLIFDSAGNLYGTTAGDGVNNDGTVFEVAAGTHALNTLVTFNGTNGARPLASLLPDGTGNLYGTTQLGGLYNDGTVFEVAAQTHTLSTVATFNGNNGSLPKGALISDSIGNLYGTASFGGMGGVGTVFEVAAGTHALSTVATFGVEGGDTPVPGGFPYAALTADKAGNFYMTTYSSEGPGNDIYGTVSEVPAGTHSITSLAAFDNTDGGNPSGTLIMDAAGDLFGTTTSGGPDLGGTVFEVAAGTDTLTTLVNLNGLVGGGSPFGGLVADAGGNLYGTVGIGGADGNGAVFEITDSGFVVPEPTSLSLLLLLTPALLIRRRRCATP